MALNVMRMEAVVPRAIIVWVGFVRLGISLIAMMGQPVLLMPASPMASTIINAVIL